VAIAAYDTYQTVQSVADGSVTVGEAAKSAATDLVVGAAVGKPIAKAFEKVGGAVTSSVKRFVGDESGAVKVPGKTQPRGPDGKWTKGEGTPPGTTSEEAVWDGVAAKDGWSVERGRVHMTDHTGQVRVYDGTATSPSGRVLGLEVKSGTATKTGPQREFDNRVNSGQSDPQGMGKHRDTSIDRAVEVRRPRE
jgi:Flp pilus assembly pilin Flp